MPELPEVQTTVTGLSRTIVGLTIEDVWTDYDSPFFKGSRTIKDPAFFGYFKKEVTGTAIRSVARRGKNILIDIGSSKKSGDEKIILIHMKMTGHIIVGNYRFKSAQTKGKGSRRTTNGSWLPDPKERKALHDPFNRFIHFVITFSNGAHLALSDMRKFATVTLAERSDMARLHEGLGPEPLQDDFTFNLFKERLAAKPRGKVKTVLMDQSIISGVGNIYSDEALFRARIHPEERVEDIPDRQLKALYEATVRVLERGIDFGGDSMSDYRNIDGERGRFQEQHRAYRKTGSPCSFKAQGKRCGGTIQRKVVGGRSAHFCPVHQKLSGRRSVIEQTI